jgi:hypothetical protein
VKLLAARGGVAPRAHEQLGILVLLAQDGDPSIASVAIETVDALPRAALEGFLARPDAGDDVRAFFAERGIGPSGAPAVDDEPLVEFDDGTDLGSLELELEALIGQPAVDADPEEGRKRVSLSTLSVVDRMKLAMRGSREQRAVLVRDANRLVSTAVLSSPKLTESEVESFARMANVSDDVLRIIGSNRQWTKSYTVIAALARNPKTPPAVSMPMVGRLNERDLKGLSVDRSVPEGLRVAARKLLASSQSRRR